MDIEKLPRISGTTYDEIIKNFVKMIPDPPKGISLHPQVLEEHPFRAGTLPSSNLVLVGDGYFYGMIRILSAEHNWLPLEVTGQKLVKEICPISQLKISKILKVGQAPFGKQDSLYVLFQYPPGDHLYALLKEVTEGKKARDDAQQAFTAAATVLAQIATTSTWDVQKSATGEQKAFRERRKKYIDDLRKEYLHNKKVIQEHASSTEFEKKWKVEVGQLAFEALDAIIENTNFDDTAPAYVHHEYDIFNLYHAHLEDNDHDIITSINNMWIPASADPKTHRAVGIAAYDYTYFLLRLELWGQFAQLPPDLLGEMGKRFQQTYTQAIKGKSLIHKSDLGFMRCHHYVCALREAIEINRGHIFFHDPTWSKPSEERTDAMISSLCKKITKIGATSAP